MGLELPLENSGSDLFNPEVVFHLYEYTRVLIALLLHQTLTHLYTLTLEPIA